MLFQPSRIRCVIKQLCEPVLVSYSVWLRTAVDARCDFVDVRSVTH